MPQLDLFMFFSTAIIIFSYALIFWSITSYLVKASFYFFHLYYCYCIQLFMKVGHYFFFNFWFLSVLNLTLLNRLYTYQSIINFHLYQMLLI
jgi:hypothetical protein